MRRRETGFTLIELLVVVAIIGILAAVAVGQYGRSIRKAEEAVLKENLFRVRTAIQLYFADKRTYPPALDSLVQEQYLLRLPVDTITGSTETWLVAQAEPTETDLFTDPGVANVFSGAPGAGLDGSPYSEW